MSKKHEKQYLNLCLSEYEKNFSDDWIEKLTWQNDDKKDSSCLIEGGKKIFDFQRTFFINISKSLLGGEYIKADEKVWHRFETYLQQEHLCPESTSNLKPKLYKLYETLDDHLRDFFLDYNAFVLSVKDNISYISHDYIFKAKTIKQLYSVDFKYFVIIKELILPLCEVEHRLSFSNEKRREITFLLLHLENNLKREEDEECRNIYRMAIYKARFILKKLLRKDDSFEVMIDKEKRIISREKLSEMPSALNALFSCFEDIYEDKDYQNTEMEKYQMLVFEGKGTFMQMAHLMHYYCNKTKSQQQIENLLNNTFERKYKSIYNNSIKQNFDKYALGTIRNFMYNCRLSYRIKRNDYTIESLKEDIEKIELLQAETLVENFYPYKKAIEYLIDEIKDLIRKRDTKYNYEQTIKLIEMYMKKFDKSVAWCKIHHFYPIQLMINESTVEDNGCKLILPSSISRPIDYEKLKEEKSAYLLDLKFIKNSLISITDRIDMEDVKKGIKDIEKRYITIGSVLIGVVTFLFGTVNIFNNDAKESFQNLLKSTLCLGTILVLFACLQILVIEDMKEKNSKWKIVVYGIVIVIYTAFLFYQVLR